MHKNYSFSYFCFVLKAFKEQLNQFGLSPQKDHILLAVSGGVDSMVLLHLFSETDFHCSIAHCNFLLRDEESEADENFVIQKAREYGMPVFVNKCDTQNKMKEGYSTEMAARLLRYEWFDQLMKANNFSKLAVGHNLNDDRETFFIKLFRGSGLSGIKGIPKQRDYIIRPLMFATRNEIEKFAQDHQLMYREDSTNATDLFLRNRIRHQLLPYLEKEFPGSLKALSNSIEKLKEEETLLSNFITNQHKKIFVKTKNGFSIKKNKLLEMNPAQFFYLLEPYGFNRDTSDNILTVARSKQTGQLFYTSHYSLLCDRNELLIQEKETHDNAEFIFNSTDTSIREPVHLKLEFINNYPGFVFENDQNIAYFDAEKIKFPLRIRHWHKGDFFTPFGMKGKKMISDFFIDEKINRFEKEKVWLLLSKETILWIIGYRSSELFRVHSKTQKILKITLYES